MHEIEPGHPGQAIDPPVDALGHGEALPSAEQVRAEELDLAIGHDPTAHRRREVSEGPTGQLLGSPAIRQTALGLVYVEVDVPPLLFHDPSEEVGEHWVFGALGQSGVPGLGGPFVDGSPGHMHRGQVRREERPQLEGERAPGVAPGRRWRNAAIRPVPADSSWAARTSAMALPCQYSS